MHYHDNDSEDTLTYVECTQCSEIKNIYLQQNYSVLISSMAEKLLVHFLEIKFVKSKVNVKYIAENEFFLACNVASVKQRTSFIWLRLICF